MIKMIKVNGNNLLNSLLLPMRILFPHHFIEKLGLKSIKTERIEKVIKHCRGRVLDVGCGDNQLIRKYKQGLGVDVYDFGGGAQIIDDASKLPFKDESFDTVTLVASFNHIVNRVDALKEIHRVLKPNGLVIVTMLNPFIGYIRHKTAFWDEDQNQRGMRKGEKFGLSDKEVIEFFFSQNFRIAKQERFIIYLNKLFVFKKI